MEFDCASPYVIPVDGTRTIAARNDTGDIRYGFQQAVGGTPFIDGIEVMSDGVQTCLMSLLNEQFPNSVAVSHDHGAPRIISAAGSLLTAIAAGTFNDTVFTA